MLSQNKNGKIAENEISMHPSMQSPMPPIWAQVGICTIDNENDP